MDPAAFGDGGRYRFFANLPPGLAQEAAENLPEPRDRRGIGGPLLEGGEIGQDLLTPGKLGTLVGAVLPARVVRLRLEAEGEWIAGVSRARDLHGQGEGRRRGVCA